MECRRATRIAEPTEGTMANYALAERQERHLANDRRHGGFTKAFVSEKEERSIGLHRAADRTAEDVAQQLGPLDTRSVVEKIVCGRDRVAMRFKAAIRANDLIRSASLAISVRPRIVPARRLGWWW